MLKSVYLSLCEVKVQKVTVIEWRCFVVKVGIDERSVVDECGSSRT